MLGCLRSACLAASPQRGACQSKVSDRRLSVAQYLWLLIRPTAAKEHRATKKLRADDREVPRLRSKQGNHEQLISGSWSRRNTVVDTDLDFLTSDDLGFGVGFHQWPILCS